MGRSLTWDDSRPDDPFLESLLAGQPAPVLTPGALAPGFVGPPVLPPDPPLARTYLPAHQSSVWLESSSQAPGCPAQFRPCLSSPDSIGCPVHGCVPRRDSAFEMGA